MRLESNLQHIAPVYVAAQSWRQENIPLVVLAGERYGAGSSRDWAAKAQALLGIKAVVARSFERIPNEPDRHGYCSVAFLTG